MKPTNKVIKKLKADIVAEKAYENKFIEARRIQKKADEERLTGYQKFKKHQDKERVLNDELMDFLAMGK